MAQEQQAGLTERARGARRPSHLRSVDRPAGKGAHTEPEPVGDLARAAVGGEPLAWPKLVRRFTGLVLAISTSYGLNEADAADVSQVVWLRLFEHIDRIRDTDRLAGWLATVTRHECLHLLRRRDWITPTSDTEVLDRLYKPPELAAAVLRPEHLPESLRSLVQALPAHQRALMEMLLRDPTPSYKEISETLDIPIGSIGPTRQRCLAALRARCISAGIEPLSA